MDDLSFNDIYKLHTGHKVIGESDDSDSSNPDVSKYEQFKPPPYTYEELQRNLVVIERLPESVFSTNNSYTHEIDSWPHGNKENDAANKKCSRGEQIARQLSKLLQSHYCFLCNKKASRKALCHYSSRPHLNRVHMWIQNQLKKFKCDTDFKLIFCDACDLPLSGMVSAQAHYEEESHKLKLQYFCSVCLRATHGASLSKHVQSKGHKMHLTKQTFPNVHKVEDKQIWSSVGQSWPEALKTLITIAECKLCCFKLSSAEEATLHYCSNSHNFQVEKFLEKYHSQNNANNSMIKCFPCNVSFISLEKLIEHQNGYYHNVMKENLSRKRPDKTENQAPSMENPVNIPPSQKEAHAQIQVPIPEKQIPETRIDKNNSSNDKHFELFEKVNIELKKLINTVYLSKKVPLEKSLRYLQMINKEMSKIIEMHRDRSNEDKSANETNGRHFESEQDKTEAKNTGAIKKTFSGALKNISYVTDNKEVDSLTQTNHSMTRECRKSTKNDSMKTKMSLEIKRLEAVLCYSNKLPLDSALGYLQTFNKTLSKLTKNDSNFYDLKSVFNYEGNVPKINHVRSNVDVNMEIKCEFDKLVQTLTDQLPLGVSLNYIVEFNMQLENEVLSIQESNRNRVDVEVEEDIQNDKIGAIERINILKENEDIQNDIIDTREASKRVFIVNENGNIQIKEINVQNEIRKTDDHVKRTEDIEVSDINNKTVFIVNENENIQNDTTNSQEIRKRVFIANENGIIQISEIDIQNEITKRIIHEEIRTGDTDEIGANLVNVDENKDIQNSAINKQVPSKNVLIVKEAEDIQTGKINAQNGFRKKVIDVEGANEDIIQISESNIQTSDIVMENKAAEIVVNVDENKNVQRGKIDAQKASMEVLIVNENEDRQFGQIDIGTEASEYVIAANENEDREGRKEFIVEVNGSGQYSEIEMQNETSRRIIGLNQIVDMNDIKFRVEENKDIENSQTGTQNGSERFNVQEKIDMKSKERRKEKTGCILA